MTVHIVAFLLGLFVVPLVLLWYGHRLRRRSPRGRAAFWGAVVGHCTAGVLAVSLGMVPPEAWTPEETWRGFVGLWSLLVFPVTGGVIGAVAHRPRPEAADASAVRAAARASRRVSA
ncbi:MAG TPA: hypothetical protein VF178_00785 [Gemmatimonadaceae bacterium]